MLAPKPTSAALRTPSSSDNSVKFFASSQRGTRQVSTRRRKKRSEGRFGPTLRMASARWSFQACAERSPTTPSVAKRLPPLPRGEFTVAHSPPRRQLHKTSLRTAPPGTVVVLRGYILNNLASRPDCACARRVSQNFSSHLCRAARAWRAPSGSCKQIEDGSVDISLADAFSDGFGPFGTPGKGPHPSLKASTVRREAIEYLKW